MDWYTGKVREPLLEGKEVMLGGQTFVVPPFKLREWIALAPARESMRKTEPGSFDDLAARATIVLMALSRNYPEMTMAMLLENLDPTDVGPAVDAVIEVNEFLRRAAGEAQAPVNGAIETTATKENAGGESSLT